ncbi:MAG: hypothetical protein H6627_04690 [Calditrichae bacterium]|nr:hypothetical protein [Calditrichia bacterium]
MKKLLLISYILVLMIAVFLESCSTIDYMSIKNGPAYGRSNHADTISLLTYNIKAIYDKEEGQVDSLMQYINKSTFDFVLFQELFDESTRDEIIDKTDTSFYKTIISRVDYNSFPELIFQDAGLYLMAHYPRVDLSDINFADDIKNSNGIIHKILDKEMSKTNDFLANKSVMGSLFNLGDSTFLFLFNTHVQAIGRREHKLFQIQQIYSFIQNSVAAVIKKGVAGSPLNMIVILAGDFNNNAYSHETYSILLETLGNPRDLHMEHNGNKEEYTFRFGSGRGSRRFDYIFSYDKISNYNFKKVSVDYINTKDIKDAQNRSISDHSALKTQLNFDRKD